jgi:hypothetical protein
MKIYTVLSSKRCNISSIQNEQQRTQDGSLWNSVQERDVVRYDTFEGDSLGSVSEERPEPLQDRSTNAKRHFKASEKDDVVDSIEGST